MEGCSGDPLQATGWSGRHPRSFQDQENLWLLPWHVHCPPRTVVRSGVIIPATPASLEQLAGAAHEDGGEVLFKIGIVLLMGWLLGVIGVDSVGDRIHILLLSGLLLLLLALAKAHDAGLTRAC